MDTVIFVSKGMEKEQLNRLINQWENHVKEIKIVSDSSYLKTMGVETEYVDELLVMRMANNLLSPFNRFLKRCLTWWCRSRQPSCCCRCSWLSPWL